PVLAERLVPSCTASEGYLVPHCPDSPVKPGRGGCHVKGWRSGLLCLLTLLTVAGRLDAQTGATATLRGEVRDAQGNAVPKAHVTVISTQTGSSREAAVDAAGVFVLADLPPGTVSVIVSADGFSEQRYTDVP